MTPTPGRCIVACAGWSLPRAVQERFPGEGSHLERYARVFGGTEINSSFHRPHRDFVWRRWADAVPEGFRFFAKLPKTLTHERKLADPAALLDAFLAECAPLGDKLAGLLVQLPPSLAFDASIADRFFTELRARWHGDVSCEPRHVTWFGPEADALLARHRTARVLADPVRFDAARAPGGFQGFVYVRLHGSPRMYYSSYAPATLDALARRIRMETRAGRTVWCVFDNTASGAAVDNALAFRDALEKTP